jgi:metal-responsive CopG/Arc/MetJ family transcriptional regulator
LEVLSISMDREDLARLGKLQKRLGFQSRSKMLRTAIMSLVKDYESLESLSGSLESVFVLSYGESDKNRVSDLLHDFKDAIKTELHQHNSGTCVDVLNIHTTAAKTRELFSALKRNRKVYSVTYAIVRETGKERQHRARNKRP